MGPDDTGDLVSFLYWSIHNMHLLKFLQQFCSGAWDTANGKHICGFELYTNTTSNYELNQFHGIRRGMPSWWLGSWPSKVNAVCRKLQCSFMLGGVCVCSVGSWIQPDMNHFFFSFLLRLLFSHVHRPTTKTSMAREEVSRITATPLGLACTAVWPWLPVLLVSVSNHSASTIISAVGLMKRLFFHCDATHDPNCGYISACDIFCQTTRGCTFVISA